MGTLIAVPSNFPFKFGKTRLKAFAAPVEVGIIDTEAVGYDAANPAKNAQYWITLNPSGEGTDKTRYYDFVYSVPDELTVKAYLDIYDNQKNKKLQLDYF